MIIYDSHRDAYLIDGEIVTSMDILENPDLETTPTLPDAAEVLFDIAERHLKPLSQGSGTLEKIGDKRRG